MISMTGRILTSMTRKTLLSAFLMCASVAGSQAQQTAAIADREIARRQEDLIVAGKLLSEGDAALAQKNYEGAYVNYLDAVVKIPAGAASGSLRATAVGKFSNGGIAYAEFLIKNGRYSEAERVAKTILLPQYNPGCKPAVQLLANLEQPDYYNKTVTPSFAADREKVTTLLYEADGFYQSGRYDLAIRRYEQVLNIDPYNIAARKGMEKVNGQRINYQTSAYNETRSRMLWLTDRAWERPVKKFQTGRSTASETAALRGGVRSTEAITAKLNRIIIPRIDLQDTTVREAVDYLKQQSRLLDTSTDNAKDKRGVNIVIKVNPMALATTPADPSAVPVETGAPTAAPASEDSRITLSLSNVPLIEAIRYLTELAGLKYKIEPYAVSIVPITENTEDLVTKEYRVPPGFIPATSDTTADAAPTAGAPVTAGGESRLKGRVKAQEYLAGQGVPFPPGSFAQYTPAGSKLIVRNTPGAIDLIDSLVDAVQGIQPTQVEIESKFLEITQNNLSELGFDWLLGPLSIGGGVYGSGGTLGNGQDLGSSYYQNFPFGSTGTDPVTAGLRSGVGTSVNSAVTANSIDALLAGIPQGATAASPAIFGLAGIFTNPQFQVVIRALNQKKGIDLMSAPKVTTKSGSKAVVRVVREFPYPTEFNPPEPPPQTTSSGTSVTALATGALISGGVVTPTTPTAFETRNLGVTLEVEPIIGSDGYTIDLNLSPEVVEFDGFVNYGSPIFTYQFNPLNFVPGVSTGISQEIATENVINQPIFSTRKVTTSVSVWDGQTVTLGGLIREDVQKTEDKVPILGDIPFAGRLFRSNVDQKIKRNLIIFVTARLMDAEGKPVRQEELEDDVVEPLGLPQEIPPPTFEAGTFGK